jgi:hypothetical protein
VIRCVFPDTHLPSTRSPVKALLAPTPQLVSLDSLTYQTGVFKMNKLLSVLIAAAFAAVSFTASAAGAAAPAAAPAAAAPAADAAAPAKDNGGKKHHGRKHKKAADAAK